jgi:hypothetical protein
MMQIIRSRAGKWIVGPITLGFLLFMVWGVIADPTRGTTQDVGSVNGESISLQQYQLAVESRLTQAREQAGGRLTAEQEQAVRNRAGRT